LQEINKKYFKLLKENIVITMQKTFPGIHPSIAEWKGQEISDFQEELLTTVNAHISEKWFYTHLKSVHKTLPRIDVLNLLSKYVGYQNWNDFVYKNSDSPSAKPKTISQGNHLFVLIPLILVLVMSALVLIFILYNNRLVEYSFSYYDAYTRELISSDKNELILLTEEESPIHYYSDSSGAIKFETNQKQITFLAKSQYYKTDTITRILKKLDHHHQVSLQVDDYALILHYFSRNAAKDWQKRRNYLNDIIDEGAVFYQVLNRISHRGMALYNKEEFIDKLTMPTGSLKNIEILETRFKEDKIALVRFMIND